MDNITIRKATLICFERYLSEFKLTNNLKELIEKAIIEIDNYPIDKLSRWLGFVQGYVIFSEQTTIDKERDFSRNLFHKAYENENISIPKSFKTKEDINENN